MIVCITEKPSVARDIAKVIGANQKHDGYIEGNGYAITWTFGHLCTLKSPADYISQWKRWSLSDLPMIPSRFGIKLIDNEGYKKQFEIISRLVREATEVINCGDAGQEGELIQRWVLQKAGVSCPVKRLWISSLTDEAIKEGFRNLRPSEELDNLYYAGLSRAIGDWLLGLNATRLYSLRYSSGGSILSVGRVQTPTLAMIVTRQREIERFKSEDYYELRAKYRDVWFNATPQKKYKEKSDALKISESLKNEAFHVIGVENKKSKESPPRLFDLTSLQVECNSIWGWSADLTLKHIQSLYEKKLTTYPRVDTTYLSDEIYGRVPEILNKMTPYSRYADKILQNKVPKLKRIFDNSKVTDHHAIIPTGESPKILSDEDERKLYHLIALRFISNFYPECIFSVTTVRGQVLQQEFKITGKTIVTPGWREVLKTEISQNKDDEPVLPAFIEGEKGNCTIDLQKKTTQPPKYFTEGTLLKAMETAGRTVESEELREALKENGIGRPSTRSSIIETLLKRGYIERRKKRISATMTGCSLIDLINDELLKSAELTGIWEKRLRMIEQGSYSPEAFLNELKLQLNEIIHSVLNDSSKEKIISQQS